MPQSPRRDWFPAILAAILAAAVFRLWLERLNYSFWLDETLIPWTIRDGPGLVIPHAFISLQSIAFCLLEWLVSLFGGTPEVMLRLLPVAAGVATLFVFYRIGTELLDRELGMTFSALCLTLPAVANETATARPYAIALLAHAAALLWLLRWLRSGRFRDGAIWALCAAMACHFHHLFVIAVPLEVGVALWCSLKGAAVSWRQVAACTAGFVVLMLPALPQALTLLRQGSLLSFAEKPSAAQLPFVLIPVVLVVMLAVFVMAAGVIGKNPRWNRPASGGQAAAFAAVLLLVPVGAFFALSVLTDMRLFLTRYLLPTAPGFVILWGWLLRGVEPAFLRRVPLVVALAVSVLTITGTSAVPGNKGEDWRAAVRSLPDSGAMLVYSGLVETRREDWLQSPEHWSYLAAPVDVYRPTVSSQDAFLIPFDIGPQQQAYVEQLLSGPLRERKTVTVIARHLFAGPDWSSWLSRRLADKGFRDVRASAYGLVDVHVFQLFAVD